MKRLINIALITMGLAILTGCETTSPSAKKGTVIGASTGALLGAVIGHQSNETGEGIFLGTVTGAAIGGFRGISKDRKENTLDREARERLINEHSSITFWQVPF